MIKEEYVDVTWNGMNRKHFESLGYTYTVKGDKFKVLTSELPRGSNSRVTAICTNVGCNHENEMAFSNYRKTVEKQGNYLCWDCGIRVGVQKFGFKEVYAHFVEHNLIPKFTTYINREQLLPFICPKHEEAGIQYITFHQMKYCKHDLRCWLCRDESNGRRSNRKQPKYNGHGPYAVSTYLRSQMRKWYNESIEYYGRKCYLTGETKNLEIHHVAKPFYQIRDEALLELGIPFRMLTNEYSDEELSKLTALVEQKHFEYGLGVPLVARLHTKLHRLLGNRKEIPQDKFYEFAAYNFAIEPSHESKLMAKAFLMSIICVDLYGPPDDAFI